MKFPHGIYAWFRVIAIALGSLVVGNAAMTLGLYMLGKPEKTAWTGYVPQSTPSAINDFILALICLIVTIYFIRHE